MIRRGQLLLVLFYLLPVLWACALVLQLGGPSMVPSAMLAVGGATAGVFFLLQPFGGSLIAHLIFGSLMYLYYAKLVFLWYIPEAGVLTLMGKVPEYAANWRVWTEAFFLTGVAVTAVAAGIPAGVIAAKLVHTHARSREQRFQEQIRALRDSKRLGFWCSAGLVVVVLAELGLWAFGIGTLGQQQVQLPGKMSALIYYTHKAVVPAVGLLFLCFWGARRQPILAVIGAGILVTYGATEILSRASRGAFLFVGLWVSFFIYLTSDRGGRTALKIFSAFGLVGFFAYPIITAYRFGQNSGLPMGEILANWSQGAFLYVVAALKIFFRLLGGESLLVVIGSDSGSVGWFPNGMSLVDYYTQEILGYPEDGPMTASPGLVGGLYMVSGLPAVWVGMFLMTVVFMLLYRLGDLRSLRSGRVFQVLLGARLVHALFGGLTTRLFADLAMMVLALVVMETLLHSRLSPPRRSVVAPPAPLPTQA